MRQSDLIRHDLPSHCCRYCGEPVGYLGRFFGWLVGLQFHNCSHSNVVKPHILDQYRSLYLPGFQGAVGEHSCAFACDPFIPRIEDWDITVDKDLGRLVFTAWWADKSRHSTYMTLQELEGANTLRHKGVFRTRMADILPRPVFSDDAVIAYDDVGWRE